MPQLEQSIRACHVVNAASRDWHCSPACSQLSSHLAQPLLLVRQEVFNVTAILTHPVELPIVYIVDSCMGVVSSLTYLVGLVEGSWLEELSSGVQVEDRLQIVMGFFEEIGGPFVMEGLDI